MSNYQLSVLGKIANLSRYFLFGDRDLKLLRTLRYFWGVSILRDLDWSTHYQKLIYSNSQFRIKRNTTAFSESIPLQIRSISKAINKILLDPEVNFILNHIGFILLIFTAATISINFMFFHCFVESTSGEINVEHFDSFKILGNRKWYYFVSWKFLFLMNINIFILLLYEHHSKFFFQIGNNNHRNYTTQQIRYHAH